MSIWRGHMTAARRRFALCAVVLAGLPFAARAQGAECEGSEPEVRSLAFSGNTVFRGADLALRISTTPSEFTRRTLRVVGVKHCLDRDELRLDVGRLRLFYRRHGYFATTVDTAVTALSDGGVRVAFLINEGQPVLVDSLRVAGLDSVTAPIADTSDLGLRRGVVFDITRLQGAIDSIKTRLRNNGFPRADVAANLGRVDTLARRVSVNLEVLAGQRARIGTIRIVATPLEGQPRHLDDATVRNLLGVKAGDLYRERELVDAQRVLYQTDLFRHVEVSLSSDTALFVSDSLVALDVSVHENYLRQVDTEAGWAVLDCFKARVQMVDKNFLGSARRLELTGQLSKLGYGQPSRLLHGSLCAPAIRADTFSATLNYVAGATLRLPLLFGLRAAPSLSVYSERRGEYQAFLRTTLVGGEASVTHEVRRGIPLRLAYSLEYGRTEAQPALLCAVFNRCDSESRALITDQNRPLAVLSSHLERMRTDNPINPRAGTALRIDLRGAAREIGSDPDIQFVKGLADGSIYRPLTRALTFAARLRLGAVLGRTLFFGDSVGFIPPEERLYAGGAASVRGYQQNELGGLIYIAQDSANHGSRDTVYFEVPEDAARRRVVPVGGNSLIVANVEVRIRSPFFPELIQYTLFADGGDVWQRGGAGTREHKASALWLNGLRWTPGIGVRVFTPVGPFQANVGYNPFASPAGPIYYDKAPNAQGYAPLYCVSPGNRIPAVRGKTGEYEQLPGRSCPSTYTPAQSNAFIRRLTFTFSIGPDF